MYNDRLTSFLEAQAQKLIGKTFVLDDVPCAILQTFPYEYPRRNVLIEHVTEEFTSICPFSGLPDFAKLTLRYAPRARCIELKSLKYYLYAFRQVKAFNEHIVNKIMEDFVQVVKPKKAEIVGEFTSRGGITNRVTVLYP